VQLTGVYTEKTETSFDDQDQKVENKSRSRDDLTEFLLKTMNIATNAGMVPFLHQTLSRFLNTNQPISDLTIYTSAVTGAIHGLSSYKLHEESELSFEQTAKEKAWVWLGLKLTNFLMQITLIEITEAISAGTIIDGLLVLGSTPFPDTFIGNVGTVILLINRLVGLGSLAYFVGPTIFKTAKITTKVFIETVTKIAQKMDEIAAEREAKLAGVKVKKLTFIFFVYSGMN